jgi:hypothetical protein
MFAFISIEITHGDFPLAGFISFEDDWVILFIVVMVPNYASGLFGLNHFVVYFKSIIGTVLYNFHTKGGGK